MESVFYGDVTTGSEIRRFQMPSSEDIYGSSGNWVKDFIKREDMLNSPNWLKLKKGEQACPQVHYITIWESEATNM